MRVQLAHNLINIFNAVTLIAIVISAMISPWWWLAILILALYLVVMYYLTQYEKQVNAALDQMWALADDKNLNAADLNELLNYTGKAPLARTETGNRTYYISKKNALAFSEVIKQSGARKRH
ncbi:hypothetical protein [Lacticaseibacillus hulanensis]|uniref:hypothetical protein n=1 Tax=Lacticaseibacillus hulanensis TaxID=2493111 RepID=UPI000FDAFC84|nr:hypothetical protein [Lacticaseibacillus hulanensis]